MKYLWQDVVNGEQCTVAWVNMGSPAGGDLFVDRSRQFENHKLRRSGLIPEANEQSAPLAL